MCGIFGCLTLSGKKPDQRSILRAVNSLKHRGPDDCGVASYKNLTLGHRRLSIIDLTTNAAKQPVISSESILAYNGMIYNFKEIKKILSVNTNFRGNSDTEVLAKCLDQFGIKKTLKKIDGMFAFAWFCKKKGDLYLVRDPMGEKPIYWAKKNNKIYFSSEMKSFFEIKEFSKKPSVNLIDEYLYTAKISGSKTIYSEINEVEPGQIIKISSRTGSIISSNYFSLEDTFENENSISNKIQKLNSLMEESMSSRSISDVPFGAMLSGGLDSSLILSYMMKNDNIKNINCYHSDVENQKFSELKDAFLVKSFLAKKFKKKIRLKSRVNYFNKYIDLLSKVTRSFDEPVHFFNSPDLLNMVNLASKDGIKVLLSGEGSDELFFGYDQFINTYEFLKKNKSQDSVIEQMYFGGGKHSIDCIKKICSSTKQEYKNSASWLWLEKNLNKYPIESLIPMFSQKFRMQMLLQRQDRVGMLCGLEMRVPFLSKNLVKFANSLKLKDKYKKNSNTTKLILKLMAAKKELVPRKIIKNKKIGFNSDMRNWLRENKMRVLIKKLVSDKNGFFKSYLDGKNTEEIINLHFDKKRRLDVLVWRIFALEVWHRVCGEGEGDFFKQESY